jgi:FMN-dependent NADH-azoreductase
MKTLLEIRSSLFGAEGQSTKLADRFAAKWLRENRDGRIVTRDLTPGDMPHLTADRYRAFGTPAGQRTPQQREDIAYSDRLVDELKAAEVVVIAAPMYNFSIPSTLRDYFDHVARPGLTFRYTSDGPEGLVTGKKTYVFITRGGVYAGGADTQIPYLKQFLGFIGLTDVTVVLADGLAMGEDLRERSLTSAREHIDGLYPLFAAA